jgi:hypothetical protein
MLSFVALHVRVMPAFVAGVFVFIDIDVLADLAGLARFKMILHLPTPYLRQKRRTLYILSVALPCVATGTLSGHILARMFSR